MIAGEFSLRIGENLNDPGDLTIQNIFGFASNDDDLVLLDSSPLNRESISEYVFTVIAMDSSGLESTATVTVTILDANDESPFITNPGYVTIYVTYVHVYIHEHVPCMYV